MKCAAATHHVHDPALALEPFHARRSHTAMHGHEVYSLFGLFLDNAEKRLWIHLHDGTALLHSLNRGLINRNRADSDCRMFEYLFAYFDDRPAGGEIHDRISTGGDRRFELLDLIIDGHPVLGRADVRIDLGPQSPADTERHDRCMLRI